MQNSAPFVWQDLLTTLKSQLLLDYCVSSLPSTLTTLYVANHTDFYQLAIPRRIVLQPYRHLVVIAAEILQTGAWFLEAKRHIL